MRKIKIFIGSSIVEFKNERQELENFIHNLSNDFIDKYEIMIIPFTCEAADNAMAITRKQDEYNKQIEESEMCFFLFYTRAGEYTKEELNLAYNTYKNSEQKKPKVYVYFKIVPEDVKTDDSIEDLKQILEKQYGHFFSTFESLDTVKLRILLNFKFQEMNFIQVGMDSGQLQVNGSPIKDVDVNKVMEFSNNEELRKLEKELQEIEPKYLKMKPEYAKGGCSDEFYREYAELASRRSSLIEQIEELKKQIFELSLSLSRDDANGDMTPRMREAYRLLEQGDTKGCLAVLDEKDLNGDYFARKKARQEKERRLKEEAKKEARLFIKQHKLAIDTLMAMYDYAGRFEEIERRYEVIVEEAEEEEVEVNVIGSYALYLDFHASSKSAEQYYLKAIEILELLAETDPKQYEADLAGSYNNLAGLFCSTQRTEEAEEFYLKALEIIKRLAETDPNRYEVFLATSYNNLASLYNDTQRTEEAEEFYFKALEIIKRLAETDPKRYEVNLAGSYNNLAGLFCSTQRTEEAEEFYLKALNCWENLYQVEPKSFESSLIQAYYDLANLYLNSERSSLAEEYFNRGDSLENTNFDDFDDDLFDDL